MRATQPVLHESGLVLSASCSIQHSVRSAAIVFPCLLPRCPHLTFRTLRLLADGEFHSGEALARTLRVSRTTVWKALQGLEEWGVTLFKVHGRGYRLVTPVDWLDVSRSSVTSARIGTSSRCTWSIRSDSTNSLLLAEAQAGAPSGLAVAAELQTRGRGRRGRGWHTGLGDALTFSLLWRFRAGCGRPARAEPRRQRGAGACAARAGRDEGHGEVAQRPALAAAQAGRRADRGAGRGRRAERCGDRHRHQRAPGRERAASASTSRSPIWPRPACRRIAIACSRMCSPSSPTC